MGLHFPKLPDMIIIDGITGSQPLCFFTGFQRMRHISIPTAQLRIASGAQRYGLSVNVRKIVWLPRHDFLEVIKRFKTGYQRVCHGYCFVNLGEHFRTLSGVDVIRSRTTGIKPFLTDSGTTFVIDVLGIFDIRPPDRMPEEPYIVKTSVCPKGFITIIQCTAR